jgi:hypothetical protein
MIRAEVAAVPTDMSKECWSEGFCCELWGNPKNARPLRKCHMSPAHALFSKKAKKNVPKQLAQKIK